MLPAVEVQSLNLWTARQVPIYHLLLQNFYLSKGKEITVERVKGSLTTTSDCVLLYFHFHSLYSCQYLCVFFTLLLFCIYKYRYMYIDRQIDRQVDRQIGRYIQIYVYRQIDRQIGRWLNAFSAFLWSRGKGWGSTRTDFLENLSFIRAKNFLSIF